MGLLPSSRRKQSCDLRDSAADDSLIYLNGHGPRGRQGRSSWKDGHPQSNVRLVRTRTLSSDVDGYGHTDFDGWVGPDLLVLQNGGVSGDRELRRLLSDTQPVGRWQERLKRLLRVYIMPQDAFTALGFLEKNMDTAIAAVEDPSRSLGYPALFIDIKHKPQVFDLQHWKDIMIAFHFDLTEPEGNHDLDLVEVKVTRQVTLGLLLGFKFLLQCLSNIGWDMLRMLLSLTNEEAMRLLAVLQSPHGHHHHHHQQQHHHTAADMLTVQELCSRYPSQLSSLGLSIVKKGRKRGVSWNHPPPQSPPADSPLHGVEVSLIGLFHSGAGLETFI